MVVEIWSLTRLVHNLKCCLYVWDPVDRLDAILESCESQSRMMLVLLRNELGRLQR